jgi:hypothetical protein
MWVLLFTDSMHPAAIHSDAVSMVDMCLTVLDKTPAQYWNAIYNTNIQIERN